MKVPRIRVSPRHGGARMLYFSISRSNFHQNSIQWKENKLVRRGGAPRRGGGDHRN